MLMSQLHNVKTDVLLGTRLRNNSKKLWVKCYRCCWYPNNFYKSYLILRNQIYIQVSYLSGLFKLNLVHIVPSEMWFRDPKWQTGWWSTTWYSGECVFWSKREQIQRAKSTARTYLHRQWWSSNCRWGWEKVQRSGRCMCAYENWCSSEASHVITSERGTERSCITREVAQKGWRQSYFCIFRWGFVL